MEAAHVRPVLLESFAVKNALNGNLEKTVKMSVLAKENSQEAAAMVTGRAFVNLDIRERTVKRYFVSF